MALTRKFLSAMGIEEDKIEEIINAHVDTVNALKEERDGYKASAEELPGVKASLEATKKELEEIKNTKPDEDPYEAKYNGLKEEYDQYKADVEKKETMRKKSDAYKALLLDAGISEKRLNAILKVTDLESIELDDDGNIKDADKVSENIKKEWEGFIVTKKEEGAKTPTPPGSTGAGNTNGGRAAQLAAQYHNNRYGTDKEE